MPGYEEKGGQPPNLEALVAKILADQEQQKERDKKIDNIQHNLKIVGNLICDESGNCRLASKEDLARVAERQGTKDLSEFTGQELWNQIKKVPRYAEDVANLHLERLKKDEDYLKKALEDKALVKGMVSILCDPSGENCRLVFNEEIDKAHKAGKGKGQGGSWLVKEKK